MVHGVLLIDKPAGITSHDVVARVRRVFRQKQVGHAGTLDPGATGLLVILLGNATRLSDYLLNRNKYYQVTAQLGLTSDSGDLDGQVEWESALQPESFVKRFGGESEYRKFITAELLALSGSVELEVPRISAIKVKGEKLCDLARSGKEVPIVKRAMTFFDLEQIQIDEVKISFSMGCSKGSYVRSLVTELGRRLKVGGTVTQLRRLKSDPFDLNDAVKLAEIEMLLGPAELSKKIISMEGLLTHWPSIEVEGSSERLIRNGQIPNKLLVSVNSLSMQTRPSHEPFWGVRVLQKESKRLISLLVGDQLAGQTLKIGMVFNNDT